MGRILVENVDFTERQWWADFSTTRCYNYESFRFSNFTDYGNFKSNFPNRRFRCVAFWPNRRFRGSANGEGGFQSDLRPLQLRGVFFSNFTALRNFIKSNFPHHHAR